MRSDDGYAYAKASWIIGKSFLGERISSLSGIHTLSELDRLIFPDRHKELPGRELLVDMEKRILERAVYQILSVVNSYSQPPKLLVRVLKGFEYSDLISESLKSLKEGKKLTSLETDLDYSYYEGLIESLFGLDADDREIASRLIADEISLRNCIWAIRLRTYYHKSEAETAKYLMDFKVHANIYQKKKSLAADAKASLDFSLDVRKDWRGWKWEKFLNQEPSAERPLDERLPDSPAHWTVDPRHFQNAAAQYLYHLFYHNFHSSPMSVSSIYCFIKLKQFEEDLLTSIAEGLSLGLDSSAVFKLLEVA